jgi:hypothetical protein
MIVFALVYLFFFLRGRIIYFCDTRDCDTFINRYTTQMTNTTSPVISVMNNKSNIFTEYHDTHQNGDIILDVCQTVCHNCVWMDFHKHVRNLVLTMGISVTREKP